MRRHRFIALLGAIGILAGQLPADAQTFSTYRCRDGSEFVAAFYEGDTRAHLQLDGKALTLPKRISTSGSRYAKGDVTLRMTKAATTLKRGKRVTECSAKPSER
jgi:membrane-bound inhibitor of C-type lysozyme